MAFLKVSIAASNLYCILYVIHTYREQKESYEVDSIGVLDKQNLKANTKSRAKTFATNLFKDCCAAPSLE